MDLVKFGIYLEKGFFVYSVKWNIMVFCFDGVIVDIFNKDLWGSDLKIL